MKLFKALGLFTCLTTLFVANLKAQSVPESPVSAYLDADYVVSCIILDKATLHLFDPSSGKNAYYVKIKPIDIIKANYPDSLLKVEYCGKSNIWVKYSEKFDSKYSPWRFLIGDSCLMFINYSQYNRGEITTDENYPNVTNKQPGYRYAFNTVKELKAKRDDTCSFIYANGKVYAEGEFANGQPTGVWKFYDKDGNRTKAGAYSNNKKDGIWKYYDAGKLAYREYYYYGSLKRRSGTDSNKVKFEYKYLADAAPRELVNFNNSNKSIDETRIENKFGADGTLLQRNIVPDGTYSGEGASKPVYVRKFYKNRNIQEEGLTINGKKMGSWVYFDETGKPTKIEIYEDDGSLMEEKILNK